MKATELRIGNLLSFVGAGGYIESAVTGFTNNGKIWFVNNPHDKECAWNPSDIKPIPLTEEWLLKFGFDKVKERDYFINCEDANSNYAHLRIAYVLDKWTVSIGDDGIGIVLGVYKFVHQLQNLYFAITGTELIIKE